MRFVRNLALLTWAAGSGLASLSLSPVLAQQFFSATVSTGGRDRPRRPALHGMPANTPPAPPPRDKTGMVPLSELGSDNYKGEPGGLYGDGENEPSPAHLQAAIKLADSIKPLNRFGFADPQGKVVLLSIGMSNTTQEFSAFKLLADADPEKSPSLLIVDGAQGGQAADSMGQQRCPGLVSGGRSAAPAGVTPEQVQVVWIKQALVAQGQYGDFPAHATTTCRRVDQNPERGE